MSTDKSGDSRSTTFNSVFVHLFSIPKYQLALYRALFPDDDRDLTEANAFKFTDSYSILNHRHELVAFAIRGFLLTVQASHRSWKNEICANAFCAGLETIAYYMLAADQDPDYVHGSAMPPHDFFILCLDDKNDLPDKVPVSDELFQSSETISFRSRIVYPGDSWNIIDQYDAFIKLVSEQAARCSECDDNDKYRRFARETLEICRKRNILTEYLAECEFDVLDILEHRLPLEERLLAEEREIEDSTSVTGEEVERPDGN